VSPRDVIAEVVAALQLAELEEQAAKACTAKPPSWLQVPIS
jgi:hypothetical protein